MIQSKPLGHRAYGSIPHLPGSRRGPGDYGLDEGQARICTEKARDKHDTIIVQEKLDGSCMSVAKHDGLIIPLMRAGYLASSSKFRQHHVFVDWVGRWALEFDRLLEEGERVCGEWLWEAHGTRYDLPHAPFVAFDIMSGHERIPHSSFGLRCQSVGLPIPRLIHHGGPASIASVLERLEPSGHGAIDPVEGAVWRVERNGKVDFLAKYVRQDKVDGKYFPENNGGNITLNTWRA